MLTAWGLHAAKQWCSKNANEWTADKDSKYETRPVWKFSSALQTFLASEAGHF